MAIGEEPIHGTGLTTGDVIAEAVRQAGSGGSPQPGQPTRFMTLTYHHTGNEDGSSASATTGVLIPNSTIAENTFWTVGVQCRAVITADGSLALISVSTADAFIGRVTGQVASTDTVSPTDNNALGGLSISTSFGSATTGDSWMSALALRLSGNNLRAIIYGMSTDTPTDWTINVQLTPIVP